MPNQNSTTTTNETLFNEMLEEIKQLILEFFPLRETLSLALVSKAFYQAIMTNSFWNQYLKKEYQVLDGSQSALQIFKTKPEARSQYFYLGKAGQLYLEVQIQGIIAKNNLTELQKAHLQAKLVKQAITQGSLTPEQAIARSSKPVVAGLDFFQQKAIKIGLSREQIVNDWYDDAHTKCLKQGKYTYEDIKGLKYKQVLGIKAGLRPDQVRNDWFGFEHAQAIKYKGYRYEQIIGLTTGQVCGMIECGLTRAQVDHAWFTMAHVFHLQKGGFYENIQGLSEIQLLGMRAGLTREQVDHAWFTHIHLTYIKSGYAYEKIKGLSENELLKLPKPTTCIIASHHRELNSRHRLFHLHSARRTSNHSISASSTLSNPQTITGSQLLRDDNRHQVNHSLQTRNQL